MAEAKAKIKKRIIVLEDKDKQGNTIVNSIYVNILKEDETGVTYEEHSPTYDEVFVPWDRIIRIKRKREDAE